MFFFQNRQLCKEYKTLKQAWLKKIERNENNPKRKWVYRSAHYDYSLLVNKSSLFYWIAKKGWTAILMNHNNFLSNWVIHDIRFRVIVFINNSFLFCIIILCLFHEDKRRLSWGNFMKKFFLKSESKENRQNGSLGELDIC